MIGWLRNRAERRRRELAELDRWRAHWSECRRWFAEFPEVALALDYLEQSATDRSTDFIHHVRTEMRRLYALRDAIRAIG